MEKIEERVAPKRGRKPIGDKKKVYKTIGTKVELEHFEEMNRIAEEKFGISINTFLGRQLSSIFDKLTSNTYSEQEVEDVVPLQLYNVEKDNELGAEVIRKYYDFLCEDRDKKKKEIDKNRAEIKEIDSKILELSKIIKNN